MEKRKIGPWVFWGAVFMVIPLWLISFHVFKDLEKQMKSFRVNLIRADVEGFFKPGEIPRISENEIFICGPSEMRKLYCRN